MKRFMLVVALSTVALFAQDDPPSRVARLNWTAGDVSFQPATLDTWTNATLNYPLTTGDHLFAGPGGRAEMHIGPNAIRLNSNSNFGFLNLDDAGVQMSLNQGAVEVRLRALDQNDAFEIDTPNGAVMLVRPGEYRIDTDPNRNATMVTVRGGQAQMYQDGNSFPVNDRQTVWFSDGYAPSPRGENQRDDFDTFTSSRNNAEDNLPRRDYVPTSMEGYQDLYAYGNWQNVPDYGWVWAPPVAVGWAPYSTGRWAYVEPWGWTWIDEAPWGFAPFHYGRWAFVRSRWLWVPGAPQYRPVYSPALVAFVGGGSFGVSVGWFPLGPHEPWIPSWHASDAYIRRANIRQVTNINVTNINVTTINYVNQRNPGAVTVVSRNDFASARPVGAAAVRVSPGQLQSVQVMGGPQIVPARTSVMIGAERARPAISERAVVARTPPPPAPVSFQARQQMLTQNQGRPLDQGQVAQLRQQQPAAVVARPAVRAIGQPAQSFQAPVNRGGNPQAVVSVPSSRPAVNPQQMDRQQQMDRMNSRPQQAPQVQPSPQFSPRQQVPQQNTPPQAQPAARPSQPKFPESRPQQVAPQSRPAQQVQPQQVAPQSRPAQQVQPQQVAPQSRPAQQVQPQQETRPQQRGPENRPPQPDARPQQRGPENRPAPEARPQGQQRHEQDSDKDKKSQ